MASFVSLPFVFFFFGDTGTILGWRIPWTKKSKFSFTKLKCYFMIEIRPKKPYGFGSQTDPIFSVDPITFSMGLTMQTSGGVAD